MDFEAFSASWQSVHDTCAKSSVSAWVTRALDSPCSPPPLARFSSAHMANKRPPTAATGAPAAAPLTVLRPINRDAAGQPLGFNFTKADPKETVAWLPAGSTALTLERPPEAGGGAGSPLILNMSPLWPLHSLFTPEQAALHPQVATPALFQDVLRLVVALEALRPGAFAGFNSLQAHASVNHFHAHTGWAEEVHKSWLRGSSSSSSASSGLVPCLGYPATPLAPQPPHLAACGLSLSLVHWALPGLQLTSTTTSTTSGGTPATSPAHLARLATAAGELCAALAAANTAHNVLFTALPTPSITIFPRRHQADSLRGAMGVAFAECIGLAVINSQQEYQALSGEGLLSELRACALPQEQLLGILTTHCHCESQAALAALAAPPATASSSSSSSSSASASGEPLPPPTAPPQPPHAQPFLATATPADIAARQAVFDKLVWALPFTVGKNVSNAARESASQAGLQEAGSASSSAASSASAASSGADSGLPPDTDLTYGETPFPVIAWALAACHSLPSGLPPPGAGLFIDLGCGVGKPLYAAALLHQWGVCRGIEMVEALLDEADLLLEDWRGGLPVLAPGSSSATNSVPPAAAAVEIELYAGDAVGVKGSSSSSSSSGWQAPRGPGLCSDPAAHLWTPADFVYACSTCFSEGLLGALLAASLRMRPGAYFLLSSTHFEHPAWEVVAEMSSAMSWGVATCYLQRRTAWVGEA